MNTKTSFITSTGKIIKKITGIKDLSLFRKNIHKKIGKLLYHKKYNASDLINVMKSLGMKQGSIVCIHASMKEFYNYIGTPKDIIKSILEVIGPEGTLIMPAFPSPALMSDKNYIFNPLRDKTEAGLLAESFRKYKGVIRSNNVQHSVCALGKYAKYLTEDHTKGHDCWDVHSPWFRMTELDAIIFDLGMPKSYIGTITHCVESQLHTTHPYWQQFFNEFRAWSYYDSQGNKQFYEQWTCSIERRQREYKLQKYFTDMEYKDTKLSNLYIKAIYSKKCLEKMIELGKKGITQYYVPSPATFEF